MIRHLAPLLVLLLSACVNMPVMHNIADVERLVANQQYGRALDILDRVDPKAPDYSERIEQRRQIEALVASHEQDILSQARQHVAAEDWGAALDLYDDALARLPRSTVLREGLDQLHQQQDRELARLDTERLLAHGNWLMAALPTYRQMAQVDPRSRATRRQLERIQRQASDTASQLAEIGDRALADDDLDTASRTLLLAGQLSDSPAIRDSVEQLQQQLAMRSAAKKQQQARAAAQSRKREVAQHHDRYLAARAEDDYLVAREHLRQLRSLDSGNAEWQQEQAALDAMIAARAEQLFKEGINAYGQGQYEKAAESWRETLNLDPGHKLARDNLERAERVLERIQTLQQRQADGG